jgi:hypothetical protein
MVIPGTDGLVCYLVCTGYFPGGIVSKIQVIDVEKVVEEASLFTIALECENKNRKVVKLAGFVDVLCDDIWLKGSFGDQAKEAFIAGRNVGGNKINWSVVPVQPIQFFTSTANQFLSYSGFYHSLKQDRPMEIKLSLFSPGEISKTLFMSPPPVKVVTSELVVNMKSLMLDPKHSDVVLKCKSEKVQSRKFYCHRAILGARSAVWKNV